MSHVKLRLWIAFFASLLLHLLPFLSALLPPPRAKPPAASLLQAQLHPPVPPQLRWEKPVEPVKTQAQPAKSTPQQSRPSPAKPTAKTWVKAVREHLQTLDQRGELYPLPSIQAGEQGEAMVLIVLDESGRIVAARIEQATPYPRLDEAALRAVRSLRALPADAPREAVIPVRFRLR